MNNGHLSVILIFLASRFSSGLTNLDCFQAREFALWVGALGSFFQVMLLIGKLAVSF